MEDEQIVEPVETSPIEMYEAPVDEQPGDSNQYIPEDDRRSPRRTRNQSTPVKGTPRSAESSMYYLDTMPTDGRPTTKPKQNTGPNTPTAYLEPQVIQQPIFYTIADPEFDPAIEASTSIPQQPAIATVYALANRPRSNTVNIVDNVATTPNQMDDKSATLYSLSSSLGPQRKMQEPNEQFLQPGPQFYSIVGNPARTSRGIQVDMAGPDGPVPILYTIVGDTPIETTRAKENQPPTYMGDRTPDVTMYTLRNDPETMRSQYQEYPIQKPTVYALVQKPRTPPKPTTKQAAAKQAPPAVFITDRTNRSIDRKPEPTYEEPVARNKAEHSPRETRYPKAEALVIPYNDEPIRSRPAVVYQEPTMRSYAEPVRSRPAAVHQEPTAYKHVDPIQRRPPPQIQNQPILLPEYRSVYAYRTQKPYRERKSNNNPIPVVSTSRAEPKPRRPLYETPSNSQRRQQSAKPKSLERSPGSKSARSRLQNNGYRSETDDDDYDRRTYKKQNYKTLEPPRAPWVPVW